MRRRGIVLALIGGVAVAVAAGGSSARALTAVTLLRLPDGGIQPQVAVDDRGAGHLVYLAGDPAHADVYYTRLDRDGRFSRPLRVNSQEGSAMATGTIRGAHLALGRGGRVHVAWHGSSVAPRAGDAAPVLYTRMNDAGTAFEPERDVVHQATGLDAGTVAADGAGHVYVVWHAETPGMTGEASRRLWVARSADEGRTFAPARAVSDAALGACGCCGAAALAGAGDELFLLFRSAVEGTRRDTYLLTSRDAGETYAAEKLHDWNIAMCPMSSYSLARGPRGVLAAWETAGEVFWTRVDGDARPRDVREPGPSQASPNRKHPVVAANARGETLLAWTEGTGWSKGGALAWQLFEADGTLMGAPGGAPGVPVWSLAAIAVRPDGAFVIIY